MSKEQAGVSEDHSHDRIFVVTFMAVLSVLVGIAVVIGIIANSIVTEDDSNPVVLQKTQERLQPVGQVYTDASQIPAAPVAAASSERSTDEIVQGVCAACHNSGLLSAPKVGDAADWKARLKATGGLDGLVMSAVNGKGSMPPRGGDAALTNEQVRAAVEALLK
ncbi:MAG: c-type cytochrome [Oceanococcus sp.]